MPTVPEIALDEMDPMSRWLYYAHGGDLHEVTPEHVLSARRAYYGMCSYIDDKVGRLLDTLDELQLQQDTVIVFTSDHGEMLGERGMWFKQSFYDWSVKVPLIIKVPGIQASAESDKLTSLVDLLPTMTDIASAGNPPEPASPLPGHSLLPLMRNDTQDWDNHVLSEYTGEGVIAPCRMLRRDNIKFIYTHGHPDLMYQLDDDPNELNNLIGQPAYADIEKAMRQELLNDWDPDRVNELCIRSQKERLLIHSSTDGDPNWAYRYRPDDGERYVRNASAVGTKAKARYPFVEPTPFIK